MVVERADFYRQYRRDRNVSLVVSDVVPTRTTCRRESPYPDITRCVRTLQDTQGLVEGEDGSELKLSERTGTTL